MVATSGEVLRAARSRAHLTLETAAAHTGITVSELDQWEREGVSGEAFVSDLLRAIRAYGMGKGEISRLFEALEAEEAARATGQEGPVL